MKNKVNQIKEFLYSPDNKLIWRKGEFLEAGTFFDVEVSNVEKEIDFSICIESLNIDEAVSILKEVTINKDIETIRKELENLLNRFLLNPNEKFYIIIKGNKNETKKKRIIKKTAYNKGCNQFGLNGLGNRVGTQECS